MRTDPRQLLGPVYYPNTNSFSPLLLPNSAINSEDFPWKASFNDCISSLRPTSILYPLQIYNSLNLIISLQLRELYHIFLRISISVSYTLGHF